MEEIRDEDRGTETMVFEMTSIQLNATLQFCIGNAYELNGKNRYNVYLVKQNRVMRCIGHYDIDMGENPKDEGGKDFNVFKYQEPTWIITSSSTLLSRDIRVPDGPERIEMNPAPETPSSFRVISPETIFELITILIANKLSVEVEDGLINAITNYITSEKGKELIARYRKCAQNNDHSSPEWKFIKHLFDDKPTLQDKEVIAHFETNFKSKSYVDAFILSQIADFLQRRHNMYFLLLNKNGRIEDYTISDAQEILERNVIPRPDNSFVLVEFDTQKPNIKLIIQKEPMMISYTLDTLPDRMKQKFPLFQRDDFRGPVDRPIVETPEPPAPVRPRKPAVPEPVRPKKPAVPELVVTEPPAPVRPMTPDAPEPPAPVRPMTPDAPEPDAPVRPRTPDAPVRPRTPEPPAPVRPRTPEPPAPTYTLEILKKKTIDELKHIIEEEINASAPVAKIQRISKKDGLITYILNPTETTLRELTDATRRNRPTGGRFTRRR
jgi:hypothetical protein